MIRIVVADDHPIVRAGLTMISLTGYPVAVSLYSARARVARDSLCARAA